MQNDEIPETLLKANSFTPSSIVIMILVGLITVLQLQHCHDINKLKNESAAVVQAVTDTTRVKYIQGQKVSETRVIKAESPKVFLNMTSNVNDAEMKVLRAKIEKLEAAKNKVESGASFTATMKYDSTASVVKGDSGSTVIESGDEYVKSRSTLYPDGTAHAFVEAKHIITGVQYVDDDGVSRMDVEDKNTHTTVENIRAFDKSNPPKKGGKTLYYIGGGILGGFLLNNFMQK